MPAAATVPLEDLVEGAAITWINATATHGQDLSSIGKRQEEEDSTDNLTLPCIIVHCEREEEDPIGTGVYRCRLEVKAHIQSDDTTDANRDLVWQKVMDVLMWDDLVARLSDASNLIVWGVIHGETVHSQVERHVEYKHTLTVWAQPQD